MLAATGGIRDTKLGETEAVSCFPDACSGKSRMANKKGTLRLEASRMECNHRKSVETDKPKKKTCQSLFVPHTRCVFPPGHQVTTSGFSRLSSFTCCFSSAAVQMPKSCGSGTLAARP